MAPGFTARKYLVENRKGRIVPGGFLNAFQPTAVSVKRVKIAGAAGARAANIVTDGQLFLYFKTFNENTPTHRAIYEHSLCQVHRFPNKKQARWLGATIFEPIINVSCSRQPFPGTAPHRHRSRWPSYTCDYYHQIIEFLLMILPGVIYCFVCF